MSAPIVLIIDNDGGMRQIIERILAPHGYTITHAEDGAQGIEKFQRNEPTLVLLDIRLSDIDAPEMLEQLRKAGRSVPIVLMSGLADAEAAAELVNKGAASANISKPFKVESLIGLLEGVISGKPAAAGKAAIAGKSAVAGKPATAGKPAAAATSSNGGNSDSKKPPAGNKSKRNVLIAAGSLAAVLIAGFVFYKLSLEGMPRQFSLISDSPSALCINEGSAYIADWMAESVYKYNLKNFTVQDKYRISGMQAAGLAYDGKFFWASHSLEGTIQKFSLEPKPASLAVFVSTGPNPSGIFFEGKNLWVADSQANKIYKYTADDKFSLLNTFESPAKSPRAIFGANGSLYIIEGITNRIYSVRATDFMVEGVYALPGFENAKERLVAGFIDGKYIWVCADAHATAWRFSLKDLKSVKM